MTLTLKRLRTVKRWESRRRIVYGPGSRRRSALQNADPGATSDLDAGPGHPRFEVPVAAAGVGAVVVEQFAVLADRHVGAVRGGVVELERPAPVAAGVRR